MQISHHKKSNFVFCPFTVIGFPTFKKSLKIVKDYVDGNGASRLFGKANMLELGIPFSDPTADGPVIQKADQIALQKGFTLKKLFPFLKKVRKFTNIPIGLLTYANPVYRYGIEKFYHHAKNAGANSILIADLSLEESKPFLHASKKYKLDQIFIVSEKTSVSRLKKILKVARGYIYVVSRSDVTGAKKDISKSLSSLIKKIKSHTHLPLIVGFGISKKSHIQKLQKTGANGYIIGSALVNKFL